jgi:inner membrane protein
MKFAMTLKLLVIGIITIVMSIALFMVNLTISDRQTYRDQAVASIESSYAGPQTITGPILIRPYTQILTTSHTNDKGVTQPVVETSHLNATYFPRDLNIHGNLVPSQRRHGLYNITVYEFTGHINTSFDITSPHLPDHATIAWGEPYLALYIADVRGITGTPTVTVNGAPATILAGADAALPWQPNLHIPIPNLNPNPTHFDVSMDLTLAGTQGFSLVPVGDSNHIQLASTWHSPLFDGQFLPRTRDVGPSGFTAAWDVPSLATSAQQQITSNPSDSVTASPSTKSPDALTVNLLSPIDPYKLSDRATKYGILFILLTFGGFFLFEVLKQLPIHPIQYLLVGFGLTIFFLLLISLSEHLPFGLTYLISSAACIGLLTFYLSYVLHSLTRGLAFGAMLTTLYAAVYGLLISEDNALILGSSLLFIVLAAVMIVTRRVDWYKTTPTTSTPPAAIP